VCLENTARMMPSPGILASLMYVEQFPVQFTVSR
jgi:hypothetical protein